MEEFLIASFLSALATGAGAVPALFMASATHRARDILIAFSAGLMVAASTFELIPEALELAGFPVIASGLLLGVLGLTFLEQNIPHTHTETPPGKNNPYPYPAQAILVVTAITFHNIPEGLSVGVSYASGVEGLGMLIAFTIGLQNAPEGFIIALFLIQQNVSRWKALLIAAFTGIIEVVAAIIGFWLTAYVYALLPLGLAFAAGSMLYIVYKELIPESHGDGHALSATYAFVFGLVVMLFFSRMF
ncbi:ZIP family metal transporter [Bacillus sp. FJAT-44742]|uniref:ZIP family metal transporter n=1 Tax=Bacillus sp. FJAT-44742 TaxID=2014005 RepID=UPI000C246EF5|nr:ZIP family metal transporter [Bacillus sp. FJAT-44742]